MDKPKDILSYRFKYDGQWRHVDNVRFEENFQTLIGLEVRKSGKFRFKVKRYKFKRIESDLQKISPLQTKKHYVELGKKKDITYIWDEEK